VVRRRRPLADAGHLKNLSLNTFGPTNKDLCGGKPSVLRARLISVAQRLAYADRNTYVADTDFVQQPGAGVSSRLNKDHLGSRAKLTRFDRSLGVAQPGTFSSTAAMGQSAQEGQGRSHACTVAAVGNGVSMAITIESGMGGEHPGINATNSADHDALVTGLRSLGPTVPVNAHSSGVATIAQVAVDGKALLKGGADLRFEGLVLGDGERGLLAEPQPSNPSPFLHRPPRAQRRGRL